MPLRFVHREGMEHKIRITRGLVGWRAHMYQDRALAQLSGRSPVKPFCRLQIDKLHALCCGAWVETVWLSLNEERTK